MVQPFLNSFQYFHINRLIPLLFVLLFLSSQTYAQSISWKYIPGGEETGECVSTSDYETGTVCYGLEYTPGTDGLLTSYTMGFFIACPPDFSPPVSASSCILEDNTLLINACETEGAILLQASAQQPALNGGVNLIAGEPVIIHQVCLDYYYLDTIDVQIDDITGISMSIDGPNGPVTDSPPFDDTRLDYGVFGAKPCSDTVVCSVDFSTFFDDIKLDTLANGKLITGDLASNSDNYQGAYDTYDEVNIFCGVPGGDDDFTLYTRMLATYDVYGNGILNEFLGDSSFVCQDTNGISGYIPFGTSPFTQSSTGDVRGYEVEVHFENHIRITAEQFFVLLRNTNSANSIYESANVVFYGPEGNPYGKAEYTGFYDVEPDLTGNCNLSILGQRYSTTGNGFFVADDITTVDLSTPCNPSAGIATSDSLVINAALNAGLHPEDVITGFKVQFLGEDIAAASTIDDGSATSGEDAIAGNNPTNTSGVLKSSFLGFAVDGCVFADPVRKPYEIQIESSPEYLSIGDTIRYNLTLINKGVDVKNPLTVTAELPVEVFNKIPSVGGMIDGSDVIFNNLSLARLDTQTFFVRASLAPNAPSRFFIQDIVDGGSFFADSSDHHIFTPWAVSSALPRSGVEHWFAPCDTALSIKYLYLDQPIVPTDSTIMSFYHIFETELHKDGGIVEITTDCGNTWLDLKDYFILNGYNDYIAGNPSQNAFSGSQIIYDRSEIDLSEFADQVVSIRYKLFSDCETAVGGWYIDDIGISNLKYSLPAKGIAVYDTFMLMDEIKPRTQIVACNDVYTTFDSGFGSFRRAIACANPVDTIRFMPNVYNDTIRMVSTIDVSKNILLDTRQKNIVISQDADVGMFDVLAQGRLEIKGLQLQHEGQVNSSTIVNQGVLSVENSTLLTPLGAGMKYQILNLGNLSLQGTVILKKI